ncbi:hypothetical protein DPMN_018376 [Dreissena polymorpha]|uniref:Uncharacterized protein n=1 Tax=Dreissena polymorpha TaxID=45954 RepID=A0A9D4NH15_DREPO|nr:hypothetical protein DPMN_018376 [Dreissena polymorpha]
MIPEGRYEHIVFAYEHMAQNIIGTNIVTKILEDRKINVTSRENAPPPGSHVFQPIVTIFELIQHIIETYILAKFYEDLNINVASSILELSSGNHLVDGHTNRHNEPTREATFHQTIATETPGVPRHQPKSNAF